MVPVNLLLIPRVIKRMYNLCNSRVTRGHMTDTSQVACSLKDMNRCDVCDNVMCRPVFLPACGHSPCCQMCAVVTKIKKCGRCGVSVKTPPARLKVNLGLSSLLRCAWPEEYAGSNRPSDNELLHELQRKIDIGRLDAAILRASQPGVYHALLHTSYRSSALKILDTEYSGIHLGTHVLRWCECGLVELPKFSKKSGRHFFACPAWSPMSRKRKRVQIGEEIDVDNGSTVPEDTKYCGSFANVSNKQKKTLNLTAIPMGVNRHAE
jgi:hypothetical protein